MKSKEALRRIIDAAQLSTDDTVLEVGPGKGVLTEELLQKAGQVIAVEKDPKLHDLLSSKFSDAIEKGRLHLVCGDILELEIPNSKFQIRNKSQPSNYKIVANLPYYITGEFMRKFLTSDTPPSSMVLLVQKEVAERIVARDGKESLPSLAAKAYGKPKYIAKVAARYFSPPPKVDSAIIAIDDISKDFFKQNRLDEERFFDLLRFCFRRKRKRVLSSIKLFIEQHESEMHKHGFDLWNSEFHKSKDGLAVGENCRIPDNARPEDLSLAEWRAIAKFLHGRPTSV